MDGSIVFASRAKCVLPWGTLAPPGEYDWSHASFGPLESTTQMANWSVQPFMASSWQKVPIVYNVRPCPPELPIPMGIWTSYLTHDSLGPCEPKTQMTHWLVQPFPLPMGDLDPCNTWFLGITRVRNPNGNSVVSGVLKGSLVWLTDRWSDRLTDHAIQSVTMGRMYMRSTAMLRNNA